MEEEKYIYEFADGEVSGINISEIPPEVLAFLEEDDLRVKANNKKERRRHFHWEAMDNGYDSVKLPDSGDTIPEIWYTEMMEILHRSIGLLSPKQKQIVQMYYSEDMKQEEIASALGVSQSAVSQMIETILKKIKKFFPKSLYFALEMYGK